MLESEQSTLRNVASLLREFPDEKADFEAVIEGLNFIVINSSQDEHYRHSLAFSSLIWETIRDCTGHSGVCEFFNQMPELRFWYLRVLRGIILLARNLCVDNHELPERLMLREKFVKTFNSFSTEFQYDEVEVALFKTLLEFSCNVTTKSVTFDKSTIQDTTIFLCYPIDKINDENLFVSFALLLRNLTTHDDFVYYFLKSDKAVRILHDFLLRDISQSNSQLTSIIENRAHEHVELSPLDNLVASVFLNVCCHESFAPFLIHVETSNPEMFLRFLNIAHLLTTSFESWNQFQLTGIMTWCFRLLESLVEEIKSYFSEKGEDEAHAKLLHSRLLIVLDILTTLAQYEHVRKFILFYNGLELLIELLHLFQEKLLRVNVQKLTKKAGISATNGRGEKIIDLTLISSRVDPDTGSIKATNFPECKLLIIEILSFLIYNNKDVQDKVRELQGLEAVLSNCVIDDNDPFIKERSITCIKVLLQDNVKNQAIVAQLESKTAVQDDSLSSAGYQIDVDDNGKIRLAHPQGS
ncbi:LANO_0A01860g1_1 [Lachancea nothofagi CBS 11611]|uniref:Ataxin-10 homolog n=1 Tax=Lachancea nothofagi CBS 11611 TaxID=1266666 RepID=A0A1G4INJ3_9SACH|nr:LANO_0A01860g1_1 [Lachancea nothofagi CBS 11611]